ncbi:phasin family protein [Geobacter sp. DSM 9736]|uniref:phasin family protein n=1 Tax=Geobacter sp. DSM 9736 TaxID=1277350 RepID=UPI000B5017FB|nr:phasin superfamily protein [Geobacter sp. DSM 9736]SNB46331.1 Polyhydroxyalkanoate synthesis regulator phasin [Geobacter sp. DSM 9736]
MFELLEKTLLMGLGAVALSQKKAEELLSDLKDRYKMSEEEGKAFLDKLQNLAKDGKARIEEITEAEVKRVVERMGMVNREEFDRLQRRVTQLENQLLAPEPVDPC